MKVYEATNESDEYKGRKRTMEIGSQFYGSWLCCCMLSGIDPALRLTK